MLTPVCHLTDVYTDRVATRIAELGEHFLEAFTAYGPIVAHHIPLTAQRAVALEAREMSNMPKPSLRFRTFVREDNLKKKNNKLVEPIWKQYS
jgi:hypothetical protein